MHRFVESGYGFDMLWFVGVLWLFVDISPVRVVCQLLMNVLGWAFIPRSSSICQLRNSIVFEIKHLPFGILHIWFCRRSYVSILQGGAAGLGTPARRAGLPIVVLQPLHLPIDCAHASMPPVNLLFLEMHPDHDCKVQLPKADACEQGKHCVLAGAHSQGSC